MSARWRLDPHLPLLLGLAAVFFAMFTQRAPYHIDTVGFLESARACLASGEWPSPLALRFLTIYAYIPFVWLFGVSGVKVLSVVLVLAFTAFYYLVVRREWGARVAFVASAIVLSVPATVITVTHLKEDFVGLSLVMPALWLLRPRPGLWRGALGGALFGLACLSKEQTLILLPFLLAHLGLAVAPVTRFRDLARLAWLKPVAPMAGAFLAAGLVTVLAFSPRFFAQISMLGTSPFTGQFLGVGSGMQGRGAELWREGMLYLAIPHVVLVPVAIWAVRRRAFTVLLWLAGALGTFLFVSNISVVQSRLFVTTAWLAAPLIALGVDRAAGALAGRRLAAATLYAGAAVLVGLQLAYLLPTLTYRIAYPPQAEFYGRLNAALPAGALLVGMDDCVLARHYTRCPCLVPPVDPDEAAAGAFVAGLTESLRTRPVFALPDVFTYDRRRHLERGIRDSMALDEAFVELGEDYHLMTYGRRISEVLGDFERRGCTVLPGERSPMAINASLTLEVSRHQLRCPGREQTLTVLEHHGVQTLLGHRSVNRLRRPASTLIR